MAGSGGLQSCMKSLEQAIADECKKLDKKPEELTRLELDGKVKASNLEPLSQLLNLEILSLGYTGLINLSTLPTLPKLKTLVLSDNKLGSDSLQHLTADKVPALRRLDLAGNANFKALEKLRPLQHLPALRRLELSGCPVRDLPDCHQQVFTMLKELEYLDNVDKAGVEREADDEEEEVEGEGGDEGGDEGEEEEGGPPLHAQLLEKEPLEDDEEDYEDEGEEEDEDEEFDEGEEEEGGDGAATGSGKKRKREGAQGGKEEEEEEEEEDE